MRGKSVTIVIMTIAAGLVAVYIAYSTNQDISDTGPPLSPMAVLSSPTFIVPAITIATCVLAAISITAWRDKVTTARPSRATGNEDLTGFSVGKKSTSGTRLVNDADGLVEATPRDNHDAMISKSTTNDQPTGFRVGKKTIGSTRIKDMEGNVASETIDSAAHTGTPPTSSSTSTNPTTTNEELTGFRVGRKTTGST
ncbi:MAG: hypothetical protein GYA24_15060 [Candidatus Lokiarchaeota archaeon]|nr:hypothetical protein [Candidatus Lokiarchaeota archaeon]